MARMVRSTEHTCSAGSPTRRGRVKISEMKIAQIKTRLYTILRLPFVIFPMLSYHETNSYH